MPKLEPTPEIMQVFAAAWRAHMDTGPLAVVAEADRAGVAAVLELVDHKYRISDDRHLVKVTVDGWTVQHPQSCRPNLFACPWGGAEGYDRGKLYLAQEIGPWGVFVGAVFETGAGVKALTLGDPVAPDAE